MYGYLIDMKQKAGFLQLNGQTFPYDVLVCLGVNQKQVVTYIEKHFVKTLTDEQKEGITCSGKGVTLQMSGGWLLLWIPVFPDTAEYFGFLAHEIFHVTDLMFRHSCHIKLSDDSDEAYAYHIAWLTQRIYEAYGFVNTRKSKRRKK